MKAKKCGICGELRGRGAWQHNQYDVNVVYHLHCLEDYYAERAHFEEREIMAWEKWSKEQKKNK